MTIRSQGFASVRIILLAAALGNWLTHPASAQLAEIAAQLAEMRLDCGAVRSSHQSAVRSASAALLACGRDNYHAPSATNHNPCNHKWVGKEVCIPAAMAYCRAEDARDAEVADCRAEVQVQRMLQAAEDRRRAEEERRRRQGIDMAQAAAEALNERRGGSPAHELSKQLTDHALKSLGAQAHSALDSLDQAFEEFDRESPNQSFRKHAVEQNTFLPMKDNAYPPPEPFDVPDSYSSLMDLADATAGKEYDLPLGDSFSSVGPGQKRWRLATDAALEGNTSVFLGDGRVGIPTDATGPSGSGAGSVSRRQAPAFDSGRARQVLSRTTEAERERQRAKAEAARQRLQASEKTDRRDALPQPDLTLDSQASIMKRVGTGCSHLERRPDGDIEVRTSCESGILVLRKSPVKAGRFTRYHVRQGRVNHFWLSDHTVRDAYFCEFGTQGCEIIAKCTRSELMSTSAKNITALVQNCLGQ